MASNWQRDKRWSDKFLPEIKQILGLYLIGEPPVEEDQRRNTDLTVLKMDAVRVGCRVRRSVGKSGYPYLEKHGDEFTIRTVRPVSGNRTELIKIIEGWGDYFFYGFANEQGDSLCRWTLCDMKIFRFSFCRHLVIHKGQAPGMERKNKDGSSEFRAFRFSDFPVEFIMAKSWNAKQEAA